MCPIRTERLILRDWGDADLPAFARLNADPRVAEFLPSVLTRKESDAMAARIRSGIGENGFGLWAVEVPEVTPFVGFVGLQAAQFEAHFTPCIEVGWRLAVEHWNRGYATEAARAAVAFGFDELGFDEIVALTVPQNRASRRVMEKLGMVHRPEDDFDHPRVPTGHPLSRHVLYRLKPEYGK